MKFTIEHLFEVDFDAFSTLLKIMNGYIAGSSVVYDYISSIEVASWQPNDMDVWIPLPEITRENIDFERDFKLDMVGRGEFPSYYSSIQTRIRIVKDFLKFHEWRETRCSNIKDYKDFHYVNPNIYKIYTFESLNPKLTKKIQIIFTTGCEPIQNLNTFDLSGCRMAWSPSVGYDLTPNYVLEDIKQKRMFVDDKYYTDRTEGRVDKYRERGFKVYREIL